jgi:hypothetical protein
MQTKSFFLSLESAGSHIVPRSSLALIHGRRDGGATEPHHRGPRLQSRLGQSRFPGPAIRMR